MRGWRYRLTLLLTLLFGAIGCGSRNIAVRPPKRPEEIVLPPQADARFSSPPVYPEPSNPNADPMHASNGRGGPGGPPGGMGGMGGGGMGGGGMGPMGMGMMGMGGMNGNGGYGR